MSHVMDLPDTLAEIDKFRATINEHFVAFDPGDVDEFVLHTTAQKAVPRAKKRSKSRPPTVRSRSRLPKSSKSPATSWARSTCAISRWSIRAT